MQRLAARIAACTLIVIAATQARAQSCIGYPAFPTAHFNASLTGVVGSDFGGGAVGFNYGSKKSGPFAGVGAGAVHYVVDPKETLINYDALAGWERYNKDQMIICPFITASAVSGNEVTLASGGTQKTTGSVLGAGLGVAFELVNRKHPSLSYNPYLTARGAYVRTSITTTAGDTTYNDKGALVSFGVGVRIKDAVQITPSFSGSTLPGSNLVFDLRFSFALQLKKP